jgi:hypothetical protein
MRRTVFPPIKLLKNTLIMSTKEKTLREDISMVFVLFECFERQTRLIWDMFKTVP